MTGGEFYADTQNAGAVCLLAQENTKTSFEIEFKF